MGAGRGRRTGIILIILILLVVLVAVGALLILQGLGGGAVGGPPAGEQPAVLPSPTPSSTVNLIVAARDIPRGARLTVRDVTVMPWPVMAEAPVPFGALIVSDQPGGPGLEQVEGRIARQDILSGDLVRDFMLTPGPEPTGLLDRGSDAALQISSGMVAVAFPLDRLSSVAYAIRPGDHVDILASLRFIDVDDEFQTPLPNQAILVTDSAELTALGLQGFTYPLGREEGGVFGTTLLVVPDVANSRPLSRQTTQIILDNIRVLRVGDWPITDIYMPIVVTAVPTPLPTPQGTPQPAPAEVTPTPGVPVPDIITLEMTPQDALVLKYVSEVGGLITIVLRSALDDEINDRVTDPVTLEYIINFRNFTPPAKLPVALDPRIDNLNAFGVETTP